MHACRACALTRSRAAQEADRAAAAIKAATASLGEALLRKEPPKPPEAEALGAAEVPQSEMFFRRPQQLLDILADLEEQNLFLIQNAQEVEEARDALEATFKCGATCSRMPDSESLSHAEREGASRSVHALAPVAALICARGTGGRRSACMRNWRRFRPQPQSWRPPSHRRRAVWSCSRRARSWAAARSCSGTPSPCRTLPARHVPPLCASAFRLIVRGPSRCRLSPSAPVLARASGPFARTLLACSAFTVLPRAVVAPVAALSQRLQVEAVYRRCGFDVDPSASTLQMLTNIEMRLEDYLKQVKALPEDVWESQEKARERERRYEARDAKLQATKEARPCLHAMHAMQVNGSPVQMQWQAPLRCPLHALSCAPPSSLLCRRIAAC
jgi:hypothetical protein